MTISLAISGFGAIGRRHADIIENTEGITLAAIADPGDSARQEAEKRGVGHFPDLASLLKGKNPDGIILATPTPLHIADGEICLAHKIPMLIEKPIATDSAAAALLVAAAEAASVPILVGHHRRHNPLIAKAREILRADTLGAVRAVHAQCWFYKPDAYFAAAAWRGQQGAGPISVNLSHDIDLLRHLCGEIESVAAMAAPSARGFANEDVAGAVLRFACGAIGTVSISDSIAAPWNWEMTAGENPAYPETGESCYLIGGDKASLSLPDLRLYAHNNGAGEPDWMTPITAEACGVGKADPLLRQMRNFRDVIRGEAAALVSGREGLQTLRVIEAIAQSAAQGSPCEVPL